MSAEWMDTLTCDGFEGLVSDIVAVLVLLEFDH